MTLQLRRIFSVAAAMRQSVFAVSLLFSVLAVSAEDVQLLTPPSGDHSSLSRLTLDGAGTVHLSWVEAQGDTSSLYYSSLHYSSLEAGSSSGGDWTKPSLISSGDNWFINWADFPSLSVNRGSNEPVSSASMTAHWLQESGRGSYDYDVKAKFYQAKTGSWSDPVTVHKDGLSAEHGFVSMLPMTNNRTMITWLDGRNTVKEKSQKAPGAAEDVRQDTNHEMHHDTQEGMGGMTLRAGIFMADGTTQSEWELDSLVCDCCQTSTAMTSNGPAVVYRDRSEDEIRDIYITRQLASGWSKPVPVFEDNWKIAGCPVNGPSIASLNGLTAVTWFSAKNDRPTVKLALSVDAGEHFGDPIVVAQDTTLGRVSSGILASGDIVVSWVETKANKAKLKLSRYSPDGRLQESLVVAEMSTSRRSGFPVMVSRDNDVLVTWTDIAEKSRVKVARIQF